MIRIPHCDAYRDGSNHRVHACISDACESYKDECSRGAVLYLRQARPGYITRDDTRSTLRLECFFCVVSAIQTGDETLPATVRLALEGANHRTLDFLVLVDKEIRRI